MGVLVMIAQLILGLSIIVTLHELGHFLAARAFGIKVEKFYLFFDAWGFKLFNFKKGDTEYGIGWLPLGGYVKIAGMIDESMDKEALKQEPQPWEFRSKPAWQRLIVMLGGVIMNFILGVIIFAFITMHYEKQYLPVDALENGIYAYELGEEAGFKTGDKIVSVNGKDLDRFKDLTSINNLMGATVTVERAGQMVEVEISDTFYQHFKNQRAPLFLDEGNYPFTIDSVYTDFAAAKAGLQKGDQVLRIDGIAINTFGEFKEATRQHIGQSMQLLILRGQDSIEKSVDVDSTAIIGILATNPYKLKEYEFGEGVKYGLQDGIGILAANLKGFGKIFSGQESASESLQGPIGIATIYGKVWRWPRFWYLTGLISLILGFMNLLPIPALDGGHAMFLSYEMITRRQLSEKFMEYAQLVGMVILISLMVFAVGNDIWKHIIN